MAPVFLGLDEGMEIHDDQLTRHGGQRGVRDIRMLQSALAMPSMGSGGEYVHADIFEMAAAYLFHIIRNHPFVDGNNRTGAMAAFTFLLTNGYLLQTDQESFYEMVLSVGEGRTGKAVAVEFYHAHSRPIGCRGRGACIRL